MNKTRWCKAYTGPFRLKDARKIAKELRGVAEIGTVAIYDARTRRRPNGGHDVWIKTFKPHEKIT